MLTTLREFRWYALAIPIAAILYGVIVTFGPSVRSAIFQTERSRIMSRVVVLTPGTVQFKPTEPTSVRLAPDAIALTPGQEFSIDVWLNSAYTTRGAQLGLEWDPKLVEVTKVDEGEFFRSWAVGHSETTVVVPGVKIDNDRGQLIPVGISLMGGVATDGPQSNGVLATIHGRAKPGASGTTRLRLDGVEVVAVLPSVIDPAHGDLQSLPAVAVADTMISVGPSPTAPSPAPARTATPVRPPTPGP
jgi:hypothetical protein